MSPCWPDCQNIQNTFPYPVSPYAFPSPSPRSAFDDPDGDKRAGDGAAAEAGHHSDPFAGSRRCRLDYILGAGAFGENYHGTSVNTKAVEEVGVRGGGRGDSSPGLPGGGLPGAGAQSGGGSQNQTTDRQAKTNLLRRELLERRWARHGCGACGGESTSTRSCPSRSTARWLALRADMDALPIQVLGKVVCSYSSQMAPHH